MGAQYEGWDVCPIGDRDREEVVAFVAARWATPLIVTRARTHHVGELPGYLVREEGRLVGVITLCIEGPECEIVTIDSAQEGRRVGGAMLARALQHAQEHGCDRVWLVTTNDNLRAIYFYQRHGFRMMAVHRDAVSRSRELKPEIPRVAPNGIPILDEVELEREI